ncbi:MAG: winged helix-turn-helix transcriptional regulator [Thaumarchaeota archaeon]|nr:winged helix-turn-helix transcriptional regulator [Nitrososphaerota archaeon]
MGKDIPSAAEQRSKMSFDGKYTRRRYREFSDVVSKFSHEMTRVPSRDPPMANNAEANLKITKAIFGKWSLEILVMLYTMKQLGFEQIRKGLQGISHRVLSEKLKQLESKALIKRKVLSTRPPRVNYSLTEKGLIVARLGEPVFLFLRYEEGMEGSADEGDEPFPDDGHPEVIE